MLRCKVAGRIDLTVKKKYRNIQRFFVCGGSHLLVESVRYLKHKKVETVIATSARQLDEIVDHAKKQSLRDFFQEQKFHYFDCDDINTDRRILDLIDEKTMGLCLGAPWEILPATLALFGDRLINYLPIRLPDYWGGAHRTWQVLRKDFHGGVCFQIMEPEADTGLILSRHEFEFPRSCQTPQDFFEAAKHEEYIALRKFFDRVLGAEDFEATPVDHSQSTFLPFLNTKAQGWINWQWTGSQLIQFIHAFSKPYSGASTVYRGATLTLSDAEFHPSNKETHPFEWGIIVRKDKKNIWISVQGGALRLWNVKSETGELMSPGSFELGSRLYTPQERLESAYVFEAKYGAKGLTAKSTNTLPEVVIESPRLKLERLTVLDATETYVDWLNDEEVTKFTETGERKHTVDSIRSFIIDVNNSDSLFLAIRLKDTNQHIGNIKLGPFTHRHKRAEVGLIIGEKAHWGKGYGSEAIKAVADYAFRSLGMIKITASISGRNIGSVKAFEKAGFIHEAVKDQHLYLDGRWDTEVLLACFAKEL
jgi:[ribosomal protein S5]-alanine N-acetyltransferase